MENIVEKLTGYKTPTEEEMVKYKPRPVDDVTSYKPRLEPFLMNVLARRFDAITKEMTNTLIRTGRSEVLAVAKDFSCAITDNRPRLVNVSWALPLHVATSSIIPKSVIQLHGNDVREGDCFLNNCSYCGNTHHADHCLCVPVFYKGEPLFFTMTRAHQADVGAPLPTTYLPHAKEIYEEGLHFPCVRIQRDYKDVDDIVRMCKLKIRIPDQWYGDYLAELGGVRIGERRLKELIDKYGLDTVNAFVEDWHVYGERSAIEAIRRFPKVSMVRETILDPVPGLLPDGVPIKVKIDVNPDEGMITVDLRDNMDCLPCGFNLTESTVFATVYNGIFNTFPSTVPHNDGAMSRVKILVRENCIVGLPKFPVGTSVATTNLTDRVVNAIQSAFAEAIEGVGLAEGGLGQGVAMAIVSGKDWRRNSAPYCTQHYSIYGGGPGTYGHDGWLMYAIPVAGGEVFIDSVEISEQRFPILIECREIIQDSMGAGKWDGAPGSKCGETPRHDPGFWLYSGEGHYNPVRGVRGGMAAAPANSYKRNKKTGEKTELPMIGYEEVTPDEVIYDDTCPGGGYGDPLERDPELVRKRSRDEWISLERAREAYGVVLDTNPEQYAVDYEATKKLREELKKKREGK